MAEGMVTRDVSVWQDSHQYQSLSGELKKIIISWLINWRYSTAPTRGDGLDVKYLAHRNLGISVHLINRFTFYLPQKKNLPKWTNLNVENKFNTKIMEVIKVSGSICILYLERSFYKKSSPRITSSMGNQYKFWSHVGNSNSKITTQSLISFVFKL